MSETYDLYQQGRAHLKGGSAAQATVALEKAKRREPEKASIREALGIAYLRIQRYEEAEQEFRVMLELSPADHYAHYGLGRALEKQGKQAEANGHYKLASSLRPQNEHYASRILDLDQDGDEPNEPAGDPPQRWDALRQLTRIRPAFVGDVYVLRTVASNAVGGG